MTAHIRTLCPIALLGVVLASGCQQNSFSSSLWNPLGLELPFTLAAKPVRVGVVAQKKGLLAPENWLPVRPAPPYAGLRAALAKHLGRGVQVEEFQPFQIAAHLQSGRLQYALVPETEFQAMQAEFGEAAPPVEPLDVPMPNDAPPPVGPAWMVLAQGEVLVRRGLIVSSAKSDVSSVSQIAGKRFAFGPKDDPVLHLGALAALETAGVKKDAIAKELLPISALPNLDLLQYHVSSFEAAKEIVYGLGTPAGVIEEVEYESLPETGGGLIPLRFAKDNFRVLARTESMRSEVSMAGPFLASPQADAETTAQVTQFLAAAASRHPQELHALGLGRFELRAVTSAPGDGLAAAPTPEP